MKISDLLRNNGCVTVNKYLVHSIGLNEAILYSELASRHEYFESRDMLVDEYFYNTQYDLQAGTGLGEKAQRTAISSLKRFGLIDCKLKGIPAKRHFTIIDNNINLLNLLSKGKDKLKSLESSTDTSVGGNLKRPRKELDTPKGSGNNTKLNNTKPIILNNDNDNGTTSDESRTMYTISNKYNKEVIKVNTNKDVMLAINKYMNDLYKQRTGEIHPKLKPNQFKEVYNNIEKHCYEWEIDYEALINMMCQFLNSNIESDWNINHFATEGILLNRMYEVAY